MGKDGTKNHNTEARRNGSGQLFHASIFWTIIVRVSIFLGAGGLILTSIWNSARGRSDPPSETLIEVVCVVLAILALFPGRLSFLWPYAVRVDPNSGLELFGPIGQLHVPISNILRVEQSSFWQGHVVQLRKPQVALIFFVIPWYFGPQRSELVSAILKAADYSSD